MTQVRASQQWHECAASVMTRLFASPVTHSCQVNGSCQIQSNPLVEPGCGVGFSTYYIAARNLLKLTIPLKGVSIRVHRPAGQPPPPPPCLALQAHPGTYRCGSCRWCATGDTAQPNQVRQMARPLRPVARPWQRWKEGQHPPDVTWHSMA